MDAPLLIAFILHDLKKFVQFIVTYPGFKSATKLNQVMNLNHIIFKNQSGTWCPYAEYEWLITENYADYQSYGAEKAKPCLKWTERGRKWITENYNKWVQNLMK